MDYINSVSEPHPNKGYKCFVIFLAWLLEYQFAGQLSHSPIHCLTQARSINALWSCLLDCWNSTVLVACWLKCWPAIKRLQVQAPLRSAFFSPMSVLSSTLKNERGVYHRILRKGCKAVGPGELVNISNLCTILVSSLSHIWSIARNNNLKKIYFWMSRN